MGKRCYIISGAQVSCQKPLSDDWFEEPVSYDSNYVRAIEPDSKEFIAPAEARRMSKILKRTICTSLSALNAAEISIPDAIITGTGMGCMENSEKFLMDIDRYGENCLKPTLFMQSTHNTISSLIAIVLKCHGYNNTYSQRGISFESALLDGWLQIMSGHVSNALVGAHDEVTPLTSSVFIQTHPEYNFISETSVSLVLSDKCGDGNCVEVESVDILHNLEYKDIAKYVGVNSDILITGLNGNCKNDEPYESVISEMSGNPLVLKYRNLFGDNYSSSAFGVYCGLRILEKGKVPSMMQTGIGDIPACVKRIAILNHSEGMEWSVIKLKID